MYVLRSENELAIGGYESVERIPAVHKGTKQEIFLCVGESLELTSYFQVGQVEP